MTIVVERRKSKSVKSDVNKIVKRKGSVIQKNKKVQQKILKLFTNHIEKLLNCLMIILKLHLRLNMGQFMEKNLKYQLLNKCSKYYQYLWHR